MLWALALPIVVYLFVSYWFSRQKVCRGGKCPGEVRQRIREVLDNPDTISYNVKDLHAPRVTGFMLKFFVWLTYTRFGMYFVVPMLMRKSNLHAMGGVYIPEEPTYYPTPQESVPEKDHSQDNNHLIGELFSQEVEEGERYSFRFPTVADFIRAYKSGQTTPTDVAKAVLDAIADSDKANPPLRAIVQSSRDVVMAMAEASTQRWQENRPLSLLDGVPVAVKEGARVEPYALRAGASFVLTIANGVPESETVRKLIDKGAVIVGMANMQEFGLGTLGSNPNKDHLTARNPYDPQCYPGGSSSGSAVSVAAGFCPITLGADGGGSVRIPAAVCGVVGLKPTFRLIRDKGAIPLAHSVGVAGPLSSSVLDTAIAMNIITKDDEGKTPLSLEGLGERRLDGMNIGVYWEYFEHADSEIVSKCRAAVSTLESLGANIVKIKIPELEEVRVAHYITIMSEVVNALAVDTDKHWDKMSLESHLPLASSSHFSSIEFLNAQKQRTRAVVTLKYFFDECKIDAIVTPATACLAPKIHPSAEKLGCAELAVTTHLARFSSLANLAGNPGLVVPVGYSSEGLPIGLQVMGGWYQEHKLLKIGLALEKSGAFPLKKPQVFYDILNKSQ